MPIYKLEAGQTLDVDIDTAWSFFSDPANLALITPPEMRFRLTDAPPDAIFPGLIITYRLTPLPIVPLEVSWATEIADVDPPRRFVDEQIAGPYALWRHVHRFEADGDGVRASDEVHWSLPLDPLSAPIAAYAVVPQLRRIFHFRAETLARMFPSPNDGEPSLSIRPL